VSVETGAENAVQQIPLHFLLRQKEIKITGWRRLPLQPGIFQK
jgi:hypothetical protein